jgi:hypothetical protein
VKSFPGIVKAVAMATMDAITEKRLQTLAEYDPVAADRLRAARPGTPGDGLAAPPIDAATEAKVAAWLAKETPDLIIVPGIGDGAEAACLLGQLPPSAATLLIEQESDRLRRLFERIPLETLAKDNRLRIAGEHVADMEAAMLSLLYLPRNPSIRIFDLAHVEARQRDIYTDALLEIRNRLRVKILNLGTLMMRGAQWQYNTFKNFPAIVRQPSALRLHNVFAGKPALIAAAGPSLTAALPFLKEHRAGFVLLAVGTALAPLRKAGLRPDLVMSVDASRKTGEQFQTACDDLYLTSSMIAYPPLLRRFRGVFVARGSANYVGQWAETFLGPTCILDAGGTVSSTALDLAVKMGCRPILTAGLDLCLSANGYSHADYSMYHGQRARPEDQVHLLPAPGNYRDTVYTRIDLRSYIDTVGDYVQRHPEVRFVNANNDGARIQGMDLIPHERIGDFMAEPFDAYAVVEDAHRNFAPVPTERISPAFQSAMDHMSETAAKATEAAMLCNRLVAMLRRPGPDAESRAQAILEQLAAVDQFILTTRDSSMLADMTLRRVYYALDAKKEEHEEKYTEAVYANRRSRRLYESIAKASSTTRDMLREAMAAIESGGDTALIDFENSPVASDLHSL